MNVLSEPRTRSRVAFPFVMAGVVVLLVALWALIAWVVIHAL